MSVSRESLWETMKEKGYSRREFMEFCGFAAVAAGLGTQATAAVAATFEKKGRPPVVWLHFQECTCCSESFIRGSHPVVADVLLDAISLDYTQTLQAAAGTAAEKCLHDTMKNYAGKYILLVEGSVPTGADGAYCCIAGESAEEILRKAARDAAAIIAWGNCASFGCVQAAKPNPTNATAISRLVGKPVINVPGCPPIADVMAAVVTHILMFGRGPELDALGRPKEFYGRRVHDTCYRRPYYDAGLFVDAWDDEGARKGYCLFRMGCRGPVTYNACSVTRWNGGVSYPIQSGHGCIGCSENGFWDNGPFYRHLPSTPGFGIESTADTIGLGLGIGVAVGVAAHAVTTNIRKRPLIAETVKESSPAGQTEDEGAK
ncbi:hydrogenase small subunit [Geothrix sp. 21YS21S-2]|uniref:hydrogenase small subunit n=1 Tax=Geothrix sp. 21YS21S-2 TaxID=3068893 RepID=UPI0027B985EE|nr:hydrogenase small subunit [Geothrix sp. 21YS21S-2]